MSVPCLEPSSAPHTPADDGGSGDGRGAAVTRGRSRRRAPSRCSEFAHAPNFRREARPLTVENHATTPPLDMLKCKRVSACNNSCRKRQFLSKDELNA